MGKRSKEKQRERRRYQKQKKAKNIDKRPAADQSSRVYAHTFTGFPHAEATDITTDCLADPTVSADCDTDMPSSCTDYTSHVSDSAEDSDGYSPLFGSDSSPSPPPSSPFMAPSENENVPLLVVDKKRRLEVHITDHQRLPGAEVVKLSAERYFREVDEHKRKARMTIKCLRNKVETLEKELSIKEKNFKVRVTKFWRNLIEGDTHGGRMVKAALKH